MDAVNSGGTFIATWVRVGHDVVSSDRVTLSRAAIAAKLQAYRARSEPRQ
jgi:hypothetical protein